MIAFLNGHHTVFNFCVHIYILFYVLYDFLEQIEMD